MAEVVTSFDVVVPTIRRVELDRPWQWLAQGWRDLTRAPLVSLGLGLVFALVSWLSPSACGGAAISTSSCRWPRAS